MATVRTRRHAKRHAEPEKRHAPAQDRQRNVTIGRSALGERHAKVGRRSILWAGRGGHFCQGEARLATIMAMGRKDKGREICITCGQTFHKKLTSKELRCTKCRKAEKKAA
jgi:hypothetical protein